ncbi:P-loop containing nucleoside triphosphate hydrolase protein [Annulohypoxylon maeteangense]|uniref:P-loop containing nucleoside triphosphate hydrolase protein n=1 Tax=Annulohypoxylon maeteangense TaxID=1927788 RepID=UPI002007ABB7|nr:P-loop containing nucleoside triphosphate hydrolase protein [Annulohypoxylon maeteangense]KAI0882677.1 P-loop containing nucleoside triphosphate hydrolase protein [Annulohypoxylon maeteangense]
MGRRSSTAVTGVARDDSDDELGIDDHPWEWVYRQAQTPDSATKRKRNDQHDIIGARMGTFECYIGDCVLLKAEGSNEAWVAIVAGFRETDDDGDKAANFLWFSTEKEIRNSDRKRKDFLPNELYITPSSDVNPLASINGRAVVMSQHEFLRRYPNSKVPRSSPGYNKTFICRRGCNTRTSTYTDEFVWEDVYSNKEDIDDLLELVQSNTRSTRKRKHDAPLEADYVATRPGQDDDYYSDDAVRRTVTTPRKRQKQTRVVTPSNRRVVVKKALEFTPLATRTLSPSYHQASPFQIARAQLHVASVPSSLPCRESEFSLVYSHLEAAITDGSGACIYISGTPGTGKTATVREVVSKLDEAVRSDELDDFIFVEINGMKITDPHQSYAMLWEALKGQRVSPSQALDLLEREFNNPSPRRVPCVVLMDELDQLVTKNQSVMYNFFNWPGLRHSRLIVLAVANTMDLPERTLSNKISSRLGLTRITFPGYNHEQLMKIIQSRLEGVPGNIVEPDAVQFASRKVAAVSGDARRALDICRRAVELAEADVRSTEPDPATPSKRARARAKGGEAEKPKNPKGKVTISTVKRAINEATTSPLQQYLRALPFASKLVLASLLVRNERTGLPDSTYGDIMEEMNRALIIDAGSRRVSLLKRTAKRSSRADVTTRRGESMLVRPAGISTAAVDLTGAGIIILEGQRAERPSKIRLAVGDEEIKLAFRDDPEIRALGITF